MAVGTNVFSEYPLLVLTLLAVAMPLVWAFQAPPLPAFYSQALACALWACAILVRQIFFSSRTEISLHPGNSPALQASLPWVLLLALLLAQVASGQSPVFAVAPSAFATAVALLITVAVNERSASDERLASRWLTALLVGILVAALLNALAIAVQAFAPSWPNDLLIARHVSDERFGGNLRQPNQLATLMVWGLISAAYLLRQRPALWVAASLPLVAALLASESRTGIISLALVAVIGLLQSRRARAWRLRGWLLLLLALVPVVLASLGAFTRSTADSSISQRLALWRDVLVLIEHNPWFGVGWGQLNFAWTLTPFAQRAPDVFDHAHSLPLQLAVELGLPAAAMIFGALLLGALRITRALWANASREMATAGMLLTVVLIHSLFEYPLWFSYFLLPSAFLYAWLLRAARPETGDKASTVYRYQCAIRVVSASASTLCIVAIVYAVGEYQKATAIHQNSRDRSALASSVAAARNSKLYGHFGDYAAIMLAGDRAELSMFDRPIRHVLDERLLTAWARALQRSGDTDRAAYVIARAREFPPNALFNDLPSASLLGTRSASEPALGPRDFR